MVCGKREERGEHEKRPQSFHPAIVSPPGALRNVGMLSPVNCPRCARGMQEIEEAGAKIDVCTSCRGTFLDAGEGDRFVDDAQKLGDALAAPLLDPQTGHPCPRCGAVTTEGGLFEKDFRVELCEGCGGMWLVSKQLSKLRSIVANGVPTARAKEKPEAARKAAKKTQPRGSGEHRCPQCRQPATRWDRWSCSCGWVWDAFTTKGVCPKCSKHWDNTRCPRCGASTPHSDWYL